MRKGKRRTIKNELQENREGLRVEAYKENKKNKPKEDLFEIKEILLQGTFKCQYSPGCDCSAY